MKRWSITSKRLDKAEMMQLVDMMNISPALVVQAESRGSSSTDHILIRKMGLEKLFVLTIRTDETDPFYG